MRMFRPGLERSGLFSTARNNIMNTALYVDTFDIAVVNIGIVAAKGGESI